MPVVQIDWQSYQLFGHDTLPSLEYDHWHRHSLATRVVMVKSIVNHFQLIVSPSSSLSSSFPSYLNYYPAASYDVTEVENKILTKKSESTEEYHLWPALYASASFTKNTSNPLTKYLLSLNGDVNVTPRYHNMTKQSIVRWAAVYATPTVIP